MITIMSFSLEYLMYVIVLLCVLLSLIVIARGSLETVFFSCPALVLSLWVAVLVSVLLRPRQSFLFASSLSTVHRTLCRGFAFILITLILPAEICRGY